MVEPRPIDKDGLISKFHALCTENMGHHERQTMQQNSQEEERRFNAFMDLLHMMGLSSEISSTYEQHAVDCMACANKVLGSHQYTEIF